MQATAASSHPRSPPHGFSNPYIRLRGVSQATAPSVRLDGAVSLFDHYSNVPTALVLWTPFLHRRSESLFCPRIVRRANTGRSMDSCVCARFPQLRA